MDTQARGEQGSRKTTDRRTLALIFIYSLLLLMECRTLPGILRARAPAPGLLTSADLVAVSTVLQALLLLSFCVRIVRISRLFLVCVGTANRATKSRDRRI